jgi:hypothetical protein
MTEGVGAAIGSSLICDLSQTDWAIISLCCFLYHIIGIWRAINCHI